MEKQDKDQREIIIEEINKEGQKHWDEMTYEKHKTNLEEADDELS